MILYKLCAKLGFLACALHRFVCMLKISASESESDYSDEDEEGESGESGFETEGERHSEDNLAYPEEKRYLLTLVLGQSVKHSV